MEDVELFMISRRFGDPNYSPGFFGIPHQNSNLNFKLLTFKSIRLVFNFNSVHTLFTTKTSFFYLQKLVLSIF